MQNMKSSPFKRYRQSILLIIILLTAAVLITTGSLYAARSDSAASTDLSQMNWDTEEDTAKTDESLSDVNWDEEGDDAEAEIDGDNLAAESWEDEDTGEESIAEEDELQVLNEEDLEKLESQERFIHISGFVLFIGYILGGILTAFFTRNRQIATTIPPELLILLHSVWPLELLLTPLFGKVSR